MLARLRFNVLGVSHNVCVCGGGMSCLEDGAL